MEKVKCVWGFRSFFVSFFSEATEAKFSGATESANLLLAPFAFEDFPHSKFKFVHGSVKKKKKKLGMKKKILQEVLLEIYEVFPYVIFFFFFCL